METAQVILASAAGALDMKIASADGTRATLIAMWRTQRNDELEGLKAFIPEQYYPRTGVAYGWKALREDLPEVPEQRDADGNVVVAGRPAGVRNYNEECSDEEVERRFFGFLFLVQTAKAKRIEADAAAAAAAEAARSGFMSPGYTVQK